MVVEAGSCASKTSRPLARLHRLRPLSPPEEIVLFCLSVAVAVGETLQQTQRAEAEAVVRCVMP